MKKLLLSVAVLSSILWCVTLLPNLHRSIDSLSLLRPVFGLGCLIGALVARNIIARMIMAALCVASLYLVYLSIPAINPGGDLRIYSKNVRYDNPRVQDLHQDIISADVDLVMLQELTSLNRDLLLHLKDPFPHQHICNTRSRGNIALASKYPFADAPKCSKIRAYLVAPVSVDNQKIWVASMHVPWPWPMNSAQAERDTWRMLSNLDGPIVLAGDFNSMVWGSRISRIKDLTRTQIAGPVRATLKHKKLIVPLPLDYVFAPGGGTMEIRPLLGSDHHGIVADVTLQRN